MNIDLFDQINVPMAISNSAKATLVLAKALYCHENNFLKEKGYISRYKSKKDITEFSTRNVRRFSKTLILNFLAHISNSFQRDRIQTLVYDDSLRVNIKLTSNVGYAHDASPVYIARQNNYRCIAEWINGNTIHSDNINVTLYAISGYYNPHAVLNLRFNFKVRFLTSGLLFEEAEATINNFLTELNAFAETLAV